MDSVDFALVVFFMDSANFSLRVVFTGSADFALVIVFHGFCKFCSESSFHRFCTGVGFCTFRRVVPNGFYRFCTGSSFHGFCRFSTASTYFLFSIDSADSREMPKKAFVKKSLESSPQGYYLFVRGRFYVNHFNVMGGPYSASVNKSLFHHKVTAPLSGVSSMSITSMSI
jgi:hypothetical protein